jgi:hypothetical protein
LLFYERKKLPQPCPLRAGLFVLATEFRVRTAGVPAR